MNQLYLTPEKSPWEQFMDEITKPSAKQVAFWAACDEYVLKCRENGDE